MLLRTSLLLQSLQDGNDDATSSTVRWADLATDLKSDEFVEVKRKKLLIIVIS